MKRLMCEVCGSVDLIKQDGVFVCQACGCKYSIEEVRKMIVEGTVDVTGSTIKVDNSAFVKKYLENARRAKEKEDWEETEKYYNMVEQNDPNNIEAIFYSAYGKARTSLVDQDIYKRQAAFKVLKNCISIIDDRYHVENKEENRVAIENMAKDLSTMFLTEFVFTQWKNGYGVVTRDNKSETYELFSQLLLQFRESILNIAKIDDQIYLYTSLKMVYKAILLSNNDVWTGDFRTRLRRWSKEADKCIETVRKKRIEEYWEEHKEDKDSLDSEKQSLQNQIDGLKRKIELFPESIAVKKIEGQIADITKKKSELSIFNIKEKKALQAKIDQRTSGDLATAKANMDAAIAPLQKQIDETTKRITEIDAELTKDR